MRARAATATARLAALVVWLYPPLAGLIFGDFHENGFAPAAVAWTLYAFDAGLVGVGACRRARDARGERGSGDLSWRSRARSGAWRIAAIAAARDRARGVAVCSALVLVAFFALIQPHAADARVSPWQPRAILRVERRRCARAARVARRRGLDFSCSSSRRCSFCRFARARCVLAVAPLAEVLFSRMPTTFTLGTHYAGAWIGYVLFAFALGAAATCAPGARAPRSVGCIALCVVELAVANPLHPGLNLRRAQPRDAALDAFLRDAAARRQRRDARRSVHAPRAAAIPGAACCRSSGVERRARASSWSTAISPDSARLQEYGAALARLVRDRPLRADRARGDIELYRRIGLLS